MIILRQELQLCLFLLKQGIKIKFSFSAVFKAVNSLFFFEYVGYQLKPQQLVTLRGCKESRRVGCVHHLGGHSPLYTDDA